MSEAEELTPEVTARLLVEERVKAAHDATATNRMVAEAQIDRNRAEIRSAALAHAMQLQAQRGVARSADKIVGDAMTFLAFLLGAPTPPENLNS